jgi:hypothetical protein
MKLAFSGKAQYTDFDRGYELYVKRSKKNECFDHKTYNRVIRMFCRGLAERLGRDGIVDLPNNLGSVAAARITRKPQYRGDRFIGYGKMDWSTGHYDGQLKTFGLVFLPSRDKTQNLRCYGFVANRRLFQKMKRDYEGGECGWTLLDFNDEMI